MCSYAHHVNDCGRVSVAQILKQQLDNFGVIFRGGQMKRCLAALILHQGIRAESE